MLTDPQFPCLGVKLLGLCSYNPSQPTLVYFTVGDAIAALGFTLAIQQLLRPIYLFRVRAYKLKVAYFPITVFGGALCSIIAMLLPNLQIQHTSALTYPIVWELLGCILIAGAYIAVAVISFIPARLYRFNLEAYTGAAARLLSSSDDTDRAVFADDVLRGGNLERLITYAQAWDRAETHGAHVEFERLKALGKPLQITGRPPISAFYLFTHRKRLREATIAGTFLRVLSDPEFCSVLVKKCSWLTAEALNSLADKRLYVDQANSFVQELAHQAIAGDDTMMARETGYKGFGSVPVLSHSLFSNWYILHHYRPLGGIGLVQTDKLSAGYVSRLAKASEMMMQTAVKGMEYWSADYMWGVQGAYESICHQWSFARSGKGKADYVVALTMGISKLYSILNAGLPRLEASRRRTLFITEPQEYRHDLVQIVAKLVFESLCGISNDFTGYNDDAWHHAIGTVSDIFPSDSNAAIGLNPLQQQLGMLLISKLKDNMNGYYPAICRVLLATIGPYAPNGAHNNRTAFNILKDAMYAELSKLVQLNATKPGKVADYLPDNVSFNPVANTLTQKYRGGTEVVTDLSALKLPPIDFTDQALWHP